MLVVLLLGVVLLGHDGEAAHGDHEVEVGVGLLQLERDGLAVDLDGVEVLAAVRALVLVAADQPALRVTRTLGDERGEEALEGVAHVRDRDVGAVLPLHVVLQREGPGLAAVGRGTGVRGEVTHERGAALGVDLVAGQTAQEQDRAGALVRGVELRRVQVVPVDLVQRVDRAALDRAGDLGGRTGGVGLGADGDGGGLGLVHGRSLVAAGPAAVAAAARAQDRGRTGGHTSGYEEVSAGKGHGLPA